MTSYLISVDTTFDSMSLNAGDIFQFDNGRGKTATLTIDVTTSPSTPFYDVQGSSGVNVVVFNISQFSSFTSLTFAGWSARDRVIINGGGGDQVVSGTSQADLIRGLGGSDRLRADAGDTVQGGNGNDFLDVLALTQADGGAGRDRLDLLLSALPATQGVNIDLTDGGGGRDAGGGLVLSGIEELYGQLTSSADSVIGGAFADRADAGSGNDLLDGRGGSDTLIGGQGDDTLSGGEGRDVLLAGTGWDRMTGGTGADRFIFRALEDVYLTPKDDEITDFEQGRDRIDLSQIDGDPSTDPPDRLFFIGETAPMVGFGTQVGCETQGANTVIFFYNNAGILQGRVLLGGAFDLKYDDFIW